MSSNSTMKALAKTEAAPGLTLIDAPTNWVPMRRTKGPFRRDYGQRALGQVGAEVSQRERGDRRGEAARTHEDGVSFHARTVPNGLVC